MSGEERSEKGQANRERKDKARRGGGAGGGSSKRTRSRPQHTPGIYGTTKHGVPLCYGWQVEGKGCASKYCTNNPYSDGEEPLDVAVVELESAVVPVPFAVERVDEGAVGSRGERAFVEVEVAPRV